MENKYLINLFSLEKSLVYYLNAINSNGVLIEKIRHNAARIGFTQEKMELLDDIIIENNQCYRQAEIYSNILASLMDARVSIVSNNLNVLMKTLNIITIAIMVPTFVVSRFSMNVKIPFGLKDTRPSGSSWAWPPSPWSGSSFFGNTRSGRADRASVPFRDISLTLLRHLN